MPGGVSAPSCFHRLTSVPLRKVTQPVVWENRATGICPRTFPAACPLPHPSSAWGVGRATAGQRPSTGLLAPACTVARLQRGEHARLTCLLQRGSGPGPLAAPCVLVLTLRLVCEAGLSWESHEGHTPPTMLGSHPAPAHSCAHLGSCGGPGLGAWSQGKGDTAGHTARWSEMWGLRARINGGRMLCSG